MRTVLVICRPDAPDPLAVEPLLETLVARGHRVVLLATADHADLADGLGLELRLLPPVPRAAPGGRIGRTASLRSTLREVFLTPMTAHWSTVERVVAEVRPDVVLVDALCIAGCLLAELPRSDRPPVVVLGTIPPPHAHPHAAPYGLGVPPHPGTVNRVRNALLHLALRRMLLRPVLRELRDEFHRLTGRELTGDTYTAAGRAEVWAHCGPERFEYPLSTASNLRFVGPLSIGRAEVLPAWWDAAQRGRTVLVLGGAGPLDELVLPAVAAFAGTGTTVLVTGVRRDRLTEALGGALPAHVLVDDAPRPAQALAAADVVLTRGHLVPALHALQRGVPVVSFGTGAEEAETGARLEWSGCGERLRTDAPTPDGLAAAVERMLGAPGHRRAAARIAAQAAAAPAEAAIADLVDELAPVGGAAMETSGSGGGTVR